MNDPLHCRRHLWLLLPLLLLFELSHTKPAYYLSIVATNNKSELKYIGDGDQEDGKVNINTFYSDRDSRRATSTTASREIGTTSADQCAV